LLKHLLKHLLKQLLKHLLKIDRAWQSYLEHL